MVTLETLVAQYYCDGNVRLVGFDPSCRDDMRAALRLLGEYSTDNGYDHNQAYEYEGVLVLDVCMRRYSYPLKSGWLRQTYLLRVDPDDGYRSSLAPVICAPIDNLILQFEHAPIPVKVVATKKRPINNPPPGFPGDSDDDNTSIVDLADGHIWLAFGTEHADEYYPVGYVDWQPKPPKDDQ